MEIIEKTVKDKGLFYWLDTEITLIHIYLYWLLAVVIGETWAFVGAGILTLFSLGYIVRTAKKISKLSTKK